MTEVETSGAEVAVYPSKIDWWIGLIMIGAPLVHLPLGVWVLFTGQAIIGIALIFWGFIMGAIIVSLTWPCHYTLSDSMLTIRSGLVNDPIHLSRIKSIEPSSSIMAAPALSMDRVMIELTDGTHRLISPSRKDQFIETVQKEIDSRS
jgi:hypothetical protein